MTPEEEHDYQEALRRIQEVKNTGTTTLSFGTELRQLPPELASLTLLKELYLSSCVHLDDISALAGLSSLQKLDLRNCNQLSDLVPLAGLTSLRELDLSYCVQLKDLSPLAGLTSLQELDLSCCGCYFEGYDIFDGADLSPLAGLTALQTLHLARNAIGDLAALTGMKSLQELNLAGAWFDDLRPLAGLKSLQTLYLDWCNRLGGDLAPLAGLTSLQTLDLSGCEELGGDLASLAGLTSLQRLDLSGCGQLHGDLASLAGLTSLHTLDLSGCIGIRRFSPLESLLPTLKYLHLWGCTLDDLPPEVCGERAGENVLDKVRAHYADLRYGPSRDTALKVFFLGNGGVGKTQLCRRLRNLEFDPSIPTTHGVQLGETTVDLEGFTEPVRLNLWDFGGQDIYHGSHALFLHGHAIFLILWTPESERQTAYQEGSLSFRHRSLSYWVDYLRAFAGTDASMLIVQSQCDTCDKRVLHPPAQVDDFPFHRSTEVSARTGLNLGLINENIKEAARDRFARRLPPPIGAGRLKVRDRLRQMLEEDQKREPAKRQHRLLDRTEFDRLCEEVGGVSDKEALLDFLHHNGVVFYRPGLFGDRIVLDQNWALEAIYALFDRKKILPLLRGYGRFNRADLERLIWWDHTTDEPKYTLAEQKVFLGMMESCSICFRVRELPRASQEGDEEDWECVAPELLLEWSDAQELLLGRLRDDPPDADATASYAFLHEGILRGYLSKIGQQAGDAAIYWKYGCWFYEQTTRSQVLIEGRWDDAQSESSAGTIRLRAWGENAEGLIDPLLEALRRLPVGQAPKIEQTKSFRVHAVSSSSASVLPRPVRNSLSGDAVSLSDQSRKC